MSVLRRTRISDPGQQSNLAGDFYFYNHFTAEEQTDSTRMPPSRMLAVADIVLSPEQMVHRPSFARPGLGKSAVHISVFNSTCSIRKTSSEDFLLSGAWGNGDLK